MPDHVLRATLSSIAAAAIPETTDLWPGISARLADRKRPARLGLERRRIGFAVAAALVLVVGFALIGPSLPGQSDTTRAADLARHDPAVAAALHGDISTVTVTSVVGPVATVVVQNAVGQTVTVTVDLLHQVVTKVYQGPQLSPALVAQALAVVRTDPRTSALLVRGATIGRTMPIVISVELVSPLPGASSEGSQTWAQVFLELDGGEWAATVDLPNAKVDQLIDPRGQQVPLP